MVVRITEGDFSPVKRKIIALKEFRILQLVGPTVAALCSNPPCYISDDFKLSVFSRVNFIVILHKKMCTGRKYLIQYT